MPAGTERQQRTTTSSPATTRMWLLDTQSLSAPGAAVIAHGTTTAGTARATVFAMNPLYCADPEREWSMASVAAYWADQ